MLQAATVKKREEQRKEVIANVVKAKIEQEKNEKLREDAKKMYIALANHAGVGDINAFEKVVDEQNQEININWVTKGGNTFLITASENGQANMVAFLLGKGAIVDKANKDGCTALCYAAQSNHLGTLRLLLEKGADPNCQPYDEGEFAFPLYMAAVTNYAEVCELLLQFGANVNQKCGGVTSLQKATQRKTHSDH